MGGPPRGTDRLAQHLLGFLRRDASSDSGGAQPCSWTRNDNEPPQRRLESSSERQVPWARAHVELPPRPVELPLTETEVAPG